MSVGAEPETTGPCAPGSTASGEQAAGRPDRAGWLLGRLTVLPALLVMAWLLATFPLLLIGRFTPVLSLSLSLPVAVVLVILGLRWAPAPCGPAWSARAAGDTRTPWWAAAGVIVVAVAFGLDQMFYHSEFIIVMRDPASYFQFAEWISRHGSLPIPQDRAAFGGTGGVLSFSSFAYYQIGTTVVPQFMAGLPMVLAGSMWAGGVHAALLMTPLLGAGAVLTFGGLVARLAGPRWAPLAALVLALTLPEQFTSRSSYSEPLTQILFLGGLCLAIDSLTRQRRAAQVSAALAGLAFGLTVLVRIDGASDILPVIPYCGLLLLGRRPQALPLFGGVVVGGLYGVVDGLVFSRPYLATNKSSIVLLALAASGVIIVTLLALPVLWKRGLPQIRGRWLPDAASALAVLVVIAFAVRPYVQTKRTPATGVQKAAVAAYQKANHLPIDPTRTYAEQSLHWVFWYIGVPAVVLGTLGAAVLARRCLRGQAPAWVLPVMVFAWTIVTFLYRPAITPDQPWASRRLVAAVLPGFILLAVWAAAWLSDWLRDHGYNGAPRAGFVGFCVAVLALPPAMTSFGLGVRDGGPLGLKLTANGLATQWTYRGEAAAVNGLCAAIPSGSSVVFVDGPAADRLTEVVRGMCGDPVARATPNTSTPKVSSVKEVVRNIQRAGRRPVLLAGTSSELKPYAGLPRKVMTLHSTMDTDTLMAPPRTTAPLKLNVWMLEPAS